MGACTSKDKRQSAENLSGQKSDPLPLKHADPFANVPFIDSEEKLATTPPPSSPTPEDTDEQTTVKNNFETNVSYSNVETVDKLKQEVASFLRESVLADSEEKQKLLDYVHKRIIGNAAEKKLLDEYLEQCFSDVREHRALDSENPIKKRLMNIVTIYVASQSSEHSFLRALYEKLGAALDLNSLNAETNEHEVVNVTITKRVRQVYLDEPSELLSDEAAKGKKTVIHLSNNEQNIPADLPEDIRRKAEEVLNNFNSVLRAK